MCERSFIRKYHISCFGANNEVRVINLISVGVDLVTDTSSDTQLYCGHGHRINLIYLSNIVSTASQSQKTAAM